MAAYADYDAATLNALIGEKLKEVSAMQGALAKLLKKSGGSVSGSSEKKKRAARGPIAWTEWTRGIKELYPKQWAKWSEAKAGTVVEFAAAMKAKKADEYTAFEQSFKAKQALAAAAGAEADSSDEEEAPKPKVKAAPKVKKAVAGAGAGAVAAAISSDDEEEAPKSVAKPVKRAHVSPAHAALWTFGGQSYYKTAAHQVWEVDLDDDGNQVVGDWAGVYLPGEDRIDDAVAEPATKPTVM